MNENINRTKRALIVGATGQDGAYLCKLLLSKGYEVFGGSRSLSAVNWRFDALNITDHISLVKMDLGNPENFADVIRRIQPSEVYNLAGNSSVARSFEKPAEVFQVDVVALVYLLEAIKAQAPSARFYQASSSEMFGRPEDIPQTETSHFSPLSPYAVGKTSAHSIVKMYREVYGLKGCCGILYNHESPLRSLDFVTRKITYGLAKICYSEASTPPLQLGNLNAARDWGYAADYVEGMWAMLQSQVMDDYILATGTVHTVREFVEECAAVFGRRILWEGTGSTEKGICDRKGKVLVEVNSSFYRPVEPNQLRGCFDKAKAQLGWEPTVTFAQLVRLMAEADRERIRAGQNCSSPP